MADRPSEPLDASDPPDPADPTHEEPDESRRRWHEFPVLIVVALVVAFIFKMFIIQAFYIPSGSMHPTLLEGDRILVCRICLRVSDIEQGDVLVFSSPHPAEAAQRSAIGGFVHWLGEGIGVAQPEDPDFIKRVAALPGQTWEIRQGLLFVDGREIDEPYLDVETDNSNYGPDVVPDGMLFMLGDNRAHSGDSRFSPSEGGLGYVPIDKVIGKAFFIVWPPSRVGRIH